MRMQHYRVPLPKWTVHALRNQQAITNMDARSPWVFRTALPSTARWISAISKLAAHLTILIGNTRHAPNLLG